MNEFLRKKEQIFEATKWLKENGYITHPISAKDWELQKITEAATDGDFIDLGADGSRVLHNVIIKGVKGRKVGVDLCVVGGDNKAEGAEYYQEDLMKTSFEDGSFDTAVSQSVIEHEVDLSLFAKETARLLRKGGRLIVSFDYWPTKVNTDGLQLYGLGWNILDEEDVWSLLFHCKQEGLEMTENIDWTVGDAVINPSYCSPFPGISYTFGILEFIKQ